MLLRRMNGMDPWSALRGEIDRLFQEFTDDWPLDRLPGFHGYPAINMWEDAEYVRVEAELPGLKMDDLEIFVVGNELTIKGNRREQANPDANYHRRERGVGSFSRVVRLPVAIEADKVEASLKDGVLLVNMPKTSEARPRKIEVKAL